MGLVLSTLSLFSTKISTFYDGLQTKPGFFGVEVVFAIYMLIVLGLVADRFLLPTLLNISKRYNLSRDWTAIIIAFGNLIPEVAYTILNFTEHGIKLTELTFACNLGVACCAISIVPALAVLVNT